MTFNVRRGERWYSLNTNLLKVAQEWKAINGLWCHTQGQWMEAHNLPLTTYINTQPLAGVSVFELMGSPTEPGDYVFENHAEIIGNYNTSFSLRTGVFPKGSKLTIINKNLIRGRGGDGSGWSYGVANQVASPAILLDYPIVLNNSEGQIIAGGNGGAVISAGNRTIGGGGGAGAPGGRYGGSMEYDYGGYITGGAGTLTTGGAGARFTRFGYVGNSGGNVGTGIAIKTNGHKMDQQPPSAPSQIAGLIQ